MGGGAPEKVGTADIVMVVVVGMVFDCWVSVLETFVNDGRGSRWWFLGCISGVGPMVLSLVVIITKKGAKSKKSYVSSNPNKKIKTDKTESQRFLLPDCRRQTWMVIYYARCPTMS